MNYEEEWEGAEGRERKDKNPDKLSEILPLFSFLMLCFETVF
jgi:hypothetical protein